MVAFSTSSSGRPGAQPSEPDVGFVDQGYYWKAIVMAPRYYGRRGCAINIRAPMEHEAKARKADCEFNDAEHVRNGPPDPVLALLRSVPSTTDLVVGARGGLSPLCQTVPV